MPIEPAAAWGDLLGRAGARVAQDLPLETRGTLTGLTGLVLEAAGLRAPVGAQCQVQGVQTVGNANTVPSLAVNGELCLKALDFLPQDVVTSIQSASKCTVYFGLQLKVSGAKIEKGNIHYFSPTIIFRADSNSIGQIS